MRLFIALILPSEIREKLAFPGGTKPDNLHITLKFLGECRDDQVPALTQALETGARGFGAFAVSLGTLGSFPGRGKPAVQWVGLKEGEGQVRALAEKLETACEAVGFPRAKRPFTAHITLARGKTLAYAEHIEAQPFTVDSVALVRSILSPSGSQYTPLTTIRL